MSLVYYHGGFPGLRAGDLLKPSPPQVTCGCPVCAARAQGRYVTVGQYRRHLQRLGPSAAAAIAMLEGAPENAPVDPPSARDAVYLTTDLEYATWYASRSKGDLYRVAPLGPLEPTTEDRFPSFTASAAQVVEVVRRTVRLTRKERRALARRWDKLDRRADRARREGVPA